MTSPPAGQEAAGGGLPPALESGQAQASPDGAVPLSQEAPGVPQAQDNDATQMSSDNDATQVSTDSDATQVSQEEPSSPSQGETIQAVEDDGELKTLPPGYRMQEYVLEKVLGVGGFGITYLATDVNLNAHVAVKEYLPETLAFRKDDTTVVSKSEKTAPMYQWGLDRFLEEARTLATFRHPNVVRVLRFFQAKGTAYMVMEFAEGVSLRKWLATRKFDVPEEALLDIILPLINGLGSVHQANFLHRDIKPDNINISNDGVPILLDFGAAVKTGSGGDDAQVLTPGYAPIEQYERKGNQGPWTDVYAMGAVLYWAISKKKPPAAPQRLKNDTMESPLVVGKGRFSKTFLSAIDSSLRLQPEERPKDMESFAIALAGGKAALSSRSLAGVHGHYESPLRKRWLTAAMAVLIAAGGAFGWYYKEVMAKPVLRVVSRPAAATFYLDDFEMGVTPLTIKTLPEGEHTVRLSMPKHRDYERKILIEEGKTQEVQAIIRQLSWSKLEVAGEPADAEVLLDGQVVGKTPLTLDKLKGGRRLLEVRKEGHVSYTAQVDIRPPETVSINPQMRLTDAGKQEIAVLLASGDRYLKLGKLSEALAAFKGVLKYQKDHTSAKRGVVQVASGWIQLSEAAALTGDLDGAEDLLDLADAALPWSDEVKKARERLIERSVANMRTRISVASPSEEQAPEEPPETSGREEGVAAKAVRAEGTWSDPYSGIVFVRVPGGCFTMGGDGLLPDQTPTHERCVKDLWMSRTEITQTQWKKVMGKNPAQQHLGGKHPAEFLSYDQALSFASSLSEKSHYAFRLPSEAEWEYACRAGGEEENGGEVAQAGESAHDAVASAAPNAWGLHDMRGNVAEWVATAYDPGGYTQPGQQDGVLGARMVVRGGHGGLEADDTRCDRRNYASASERQPWLGLRLVRDGS